MSRNRPLESRPASKESKNDFDNAPLFMRLPHRLHRDAVLILQVLNGNDRLPQHLQHVVELPRRLILILQILNDVIRREMLSTKFPAKESTCQK